jgi:hypothetical protein
VETRGVRGHLPGGRVALTPGGCQIGYMCDQNLTYGLRSLPGGVRLVTRATRTRLMGCAHSRGCQIGYMDILAVIIWMCFACHFRVTDGLHGP